MRDPLEQYEQDEMLNFIKRHPELLLSLSLKDAWLRDLHQLIDEADQTGETKVILPNGQALRIARLSPGYQGISLHFADGQWSDTTHTITFANRDQLLSFLATGASPET